MWEDERFAELGMRGGWKISHESLFSGTRNITRAKISHKGPDMSKKTKLAFWIVSHCETDNKREDYAKKLQEYMPIDIYGKCGPLNCSKG